MANYHRHGITLSEPQIKVLARGGKVRLSKEDLKGDHELDFTKTQMKRMKKAHENGKGSMIQFSAAQLRHHKKGGNILSEILNAAKKQGPKLAKLALEEGIKHARNNP